MKIRAGFLIDYEVEDISEAAAVEKIIDQQLELIVKNLEESLAIIQDDQMELVNEQFLNYFRKIIIRNQGFTQDQLQAT